MEMNDSHWGRPARTLVWCVCFTLACFPALSFAQALTCPPTPPVVTYPVGTAAPVDVDAVIVDTSSGSTVLRGEDCIATSFPPVSAANQSVSANADSGVIVTEHALRRLQLVPESQRFDYSENLLRIKNPTASAINYSVTFSTDDTVIPFGWRLQFCEKASGAGNCATGTLVELGPEDETNAARTVTIADISSLTIAANSSTDFLIKVFPSWDTLFNGGTIPLQVTVNSASGNQDITSFAASTARFDPATNAICPSPLAPPPPPPQFAASRVTLPFFDPGLTANFVGRPALMVTQSLLTNENGNTNRRLGDIKLFYADCLLGNVCETGEDPDDPDTVSLLTNGGSAVGLGWVLSQMTPGTDNVSSDRSIRQIYFANNNGAPTADDSYSMLDFGLSNCATLSGSSYLDVANASWLGAVSDCSGDLATDRTKRLIAFERGNVLASSPFPRDTQRQVLVADKYIDPGTSDEVVLLGNVTTGTEWLLPDLLGSPPLIIGPPKLFPEPLTAFGDVDFDVWAREDAQQQRSIVLYAMDNNGVLHAFLMSRYTGTPDSKHFYDGFGAFFGDTEVRELWSYVPKGAMPTLKYTVNNDHHYFGDGLLRAIDIQMKDASNAFESDDFRTVLVGYQGRGGGGIFALDVTDPDAPKVFWDLGCEENQHVGGVDGDCLDGDELSVQSAPVLGRVTDSAGTARWVAIYGSGSPVSDFVNDYASQQSWLTMREIQTGDVVKQVKVSDKSGNLLTDLTPLRNPRSGEVEAIYFGDYYGAQWRVTSARLGASSLADGATLTEANDLLFKDTDYSANTVAAETLRPITARTRLAQDQFRNIWAFFGSGDYVFDLDAEFAIESNHQRFYGLRDDSLAATYSGTSNLVDMSDTVDGSGNLTNSSWFIELGNPVTAAGAATDRTINERVLSPGIVFAGLACFPTFQLPSNADRCSDEGISRLYCVDFQNGRADVATDPRLASSDFSEASAAPQGEPLVLLPTAGNLAPGKIFQGGPLESVDRTKGKDTEAAQACDVLLWRDRG